MLSLMLSETCLLEKIFYLRTRVMILNAGVIFSQHEEFPNQVGQAGSRNRIRVRLCNTNKSVKNCVPGVIPFFIWKLQEKPYPH